MQYQKMERLKNVLSKYIDSEKNFEPLLDVVEKVETKKNETLLKPGEVSKYLYFIEKGLVRFFLNNEDKNEITSRFFSEGEFFSSFVSFSSGEASHFGIAALEKCVLYRMTRADLLKLYQEHPSFAKLGIALQEAALKDTITNSMQLVSQNAEDRYRKLMQENSQLVLRVPVKHLATYLGIHPNSLSRLRKNLR